MCSFSKPCAKRMNAMQKRSDHSSCYSSYSRHINTFLCRLYFWPNFSSIPIVFAGEECIPDQFLGFPGLAGSFKIPRFSSGKGIDCHNICHFVWFHSAVTVSISYLFLFGVATVKCLSVWQLLVILFAALTCLFSHTWCRENVYSSRGSFVVCQG